MNHIRDTQHRQSVWEHQGNYYLCSTSIDASEVMVFAADSTGEAGSYEDLYVSYDLAMSHAEHMEQFAKVLDTYGA